MNGKISVLLGQMSQELDDLQRTADRAAKLLAQAKKTDDDGYLDGVALNLYSYYSGVEHLFTQIARTLEQSVPSGPNWHQELLHQMAAEATGIRPPVISRETRDCLDEYRGFRHVVRNVYALNLRPSRIEELTNGLMPCHQKVLRDFQTFRQFLIGLSAGR